MKIMLIGFGNVGQHFAELLLRTHETLEASYDLSARIVAVADSRGLVMREDGVDLSQVLARKRTHGTMGFQTHGDVISAIREAEADVVVEVTPTNIRTGQPGLTHIQEALKAGKHVVTANKGPLALSFTLLKRSAERRKVQLKYSATVGAGTPFLRYAQQCVLKGGIQEVRGILNATTNYILTHMESEGETLTTALKHAQNLGYAEADPSLDLDGFDTACKLVILANSILNMKATLPQVRIRGIREVGSEELMEAKEKGKAIRLVGTIKRGISVRPMEISRKDPLCVDGPLNAVTYVTRLLGEQTLIGTGAGGATTAAAILGDIIDIWQEIGEEKPS